MQYAFLEKLAADGHISSSDKKGIYDTCSDIITKVAFKNPFGKKAPSWKDVGEAWAEQAKHPLTRVLLPAGIVGGLAYAASNRLASKEAKGINICKMNLMKHPDFSAYPEKTEARFDEIAKIAPAVAAKPELVLRLVRGSLHSGFTTEDVQRLAQLQATYEKNIFSSTSPAEAVQRALSKKASALPSEDAGRIAATLVRILSEAGLGDLNKTAAMPWKRSGFDKATNIAKQVLTTGAIVSGFGALVGLGTGAINQAADIYKSKQKDAKLRASFLEAMRRSDPGREPLHANKEKALQAFQTLTHFAPHVAADPEAARAFMLNLISMDQGVQVGAIKDLSEIEKNLKTVRPENPFLKGFQAGAETAGMQSALGDVTKSVLDPFVEHGTSEIKREMGY
jgi:hypothetical protein